MESGDIQTLFDKKISESGGNEQEKFEWVILRSL
jgi:hypothetical protein